MEWDATNSVMTFHSSRELAPAFTPPAEAPEAVVPAIVLNVETTIIWAWLDSTAVITYHGYDNKGTDTYLIGDPPVPPVYEPVAVKGLLP